MNNDKDKLSYQLCQVAVIFFSMLAMGTSAGMNAVLFPVTMKEGGSQNLLIGAVLSLEMGAIILANMILPRVRAFLHTRRVMIISMFLRIFPLLVMPFLVEPHYWVVLIIIHGIGMFTFQMLLQIWLNTIPIKKCRGLMMASWGTALSVGLTFGPMIVQHAESKALADMVYNIPVLRCFHEHVPFLISAWISLLASLPIMIGWKFVPMLQGDRNIKMLTIIRRVPVVMATGLLVGVSIFGMQSFITLYGMMNNLNVYDALLLLSAFMFGGLTLEALITSLSDLFDRSKVMMLTAATGLICAACLPIAIYNQYQSWLLLYIWGGVAASMFSVCAAIIGESFKDNELIAANTTFFTMYVIGGCIGTFMIGATMEFVQSDGLPYSIMIATVIYITYSLAHYIATMNSPLKETV